MQDKKRLARAFRDRVSAARRDQVVRTLARAIAAGQLQAATNTDFAADLLLGPIYYRRLVRGEAIPARFARDLVAAFYAAYEPKR